jgi:hypothetical protein
MSKCGIPIFARSLAALLLAVFMYACQPLGTNQICPVPLETKTYTVRGEWYDGVDLLIVVDNSYSMETEQQILSENINTLITSLVDPTTGPDWTFPAVENVRVAVVTTDMGLQYGEEGSTEGFPYGLDVESCTDQNPAGDNGTFERLAASKKCSVQDDEQPWNETTKFERNTTLAADVACKVIQGTVGCGVEQPLEAALRAVSREDQKSFLVWNHILAVLIVTDEEDCSVADKGLFSTPEFVSGVGSDGLLNVGCNLPASNEDNFLFKSSRYRQKLIEAKDNRTSAVFFSAIVGVPPDSPCEGSGYNLERCLNRSKMQLKIQKFNDSHNAYNHFAPACERFVNGREITSARPGRRYVEVAQDFGPYGYVHSICNEDWSPALKEIALALAGTVCGCQCLHRPFDWEQISEEQQDELDCPNCGTANCSLLVAYERDLDDPDLNCPFELEEDSLPEIAEYIDNGNKETKRSIMCPVAKIPTPLDCVTADEISDSVQDKVGWYYCENRNKEDFNDVCGDGLDNDGDGLTDCMDDNCSACPSCNGNGVGCEMKECRYNIRLTQAAKKITVGSYVKIRCSQSSHRIDNNCHENTSETCNDGMDNDFNGVFDCTDTYNDLNPVHSHRPDPNCCPMTKEANGKCVLDKPAMRAICNSPEGTLPDACYAAAEMLKCELDMD